MPLRRIAGHQIEDMMSEFNKTPRLVLLPAVDVADGKAVRLTQGEAGTETNYGDPVDAAADWADQGAEWIHLVDLDAAFGRGNNHGVDQEGHQAGRAASTSSSPAASATTQSLEAALDDRRQAHQPRHRRAGEPRVGGQRDRRSTARRSPSASTCAARRSPPAAGPRTAATSGR